MNETRPGHGVAMYNNTIVQPIIPFHIYALIVRHVLLIQVS